MVGRHRAKISTENTMLRNNDCPAAFEAFSRSFTPTYLAMAADTPMASPLPTPQMLAYTG